ncbi:MAG: phosphonate metabolism protein/1,5-bisphosphokinase (PRPP-forming) PhnN [Tardiphaga sp.]|nr:phosphonate metabolism protein/1,5-bisphosphokinase (PRPP-forming) PhnN [Tardiphaga sp.]
MTGAPTISGHRATTIGPGRLVLVVGPSGAGKDTLIGIAQAACADHGDVVFPRRVVTRAASSAEDNEHISLETFRLARARGDFAIHWEAHGHCYGLRSSLNDEIRAGRTVVANISRTVVQAMRSTYAEVSVVSITAPPEVLAERLAMRARSSDGQLADRLGRAVDSVAAAPDVIINNVGSAEHHAGELVRIIRGN